MKNALTLLLLLLTITISSCNKDDDDPQGGNTYEDKLIANSPWHPVSVKIDGVEYYDNCLADNLYVYKADGTFTMTEGSNVCMGGGNQSGTWSINAAGTTYTFNVVGQFDTEITALSSSVFEYRYSASFGGISTTSVYRFEN